VCYEPPLAIIRSASIPIAYNKPLVPGRDDVTGEPLIQRPDDNPVRLNRQYLEYTEQRYRKLFPGG
jgi:hypothetical protein